jgi:hypothetical protein
VQSKPGWQGTGFPTQRVGVGLHNRLVQRLEANLVVQALLLIERSKTDFWMEDPVHPFLVQPVLLSAVAGSVRSTGTGTGAG